MINARRIAPMLLVLAIVGTPALAGFEKTARQVFIAWPNLSTSELPPQAEYQILAIADPDGVNSPVIYVINYTYKSKTIPVGAFNCNRSFEILDSSTNGLYDIACESKNVFNKIEKTILKADKNGTYFAQF